MDTSRYKEPQLGSKSCNTMLPHAIYRYGRYFAMILLIFDLKLGFHSFILANFPTISGSYPKWTLLGPRCHK